MKLPQKQGFDALVEITREMMRAKLSRRTMLTAGGFAALTATARAAGGFGNPDLPPEGAVNVTNPKALTDPGPQDPGLAGYEPSFLNPPATDVNGMPQFWASFNWRPNEFRMAAGPGRSPGTTSTSRRPSRASTCAWARAAFASSTGISRPSGPSLPTATAG